MIFRLASLLELSSLRIPWDTDLSHFPPQAVAEITAVFNDPSLQPFFAQFSSVVEQALRALNQAESQAYQDEQQTL